jgi:hypothetical protein
MYSRGQNHNALPHRARVGAGDAGVLGIRGGVHYAPKNAQLHDQLDRVVGTLLKPTRV